MTKNAVFHLVSGCFLLAASVASHAQATDPAAEPAGEAAQTPKPQFRSRLLIEEVLVLQPGNTET